MFLSLQYKNQRKSKKRTNEKVMNTRTGEGKVHKEHGNKSNGFHGYSV